MLALEAAIRTISETVYARALSPERALGATERLLICATGAVSIRTDRDAEK